ncbi:TDE1717 family outer membrane beta-barrel protein [Borrelia hermsii]|uniref:Uncharacterized protein n=3 Tax=Borrelia hermsii TaxID=140 RepID=A0AAN0X4P5_BORHE|nr:hypothetical protein [Borrelia hermsii]AAX17319.1 hypothetical protein BH0824 [Borrelia hermsii DAH]AJW73597.1 hypothetical protein L283_04160 [Borrelia hermsii CC1]AMR75048.1 hypothetical protein A0V01_00140 [Borrelia hermsii]ANA43622.1 hypothetical protein AXX13_04180 [Borrelia hermsii HS1]UCP01816.1 hypothetical protein K9R62_04220 [Borrelia hermsii]
MKKYVFLLFLFFPSSALIFAYPLSFGGGFSYQFTNYTGKSDINRSVKNYSRVDNGINLNLFFDANYVILDISYKDAFLSSHHGRYFAFGLYGIYPIVFKEYVRTLFPLLGIKYTIDLSTKRQDLVFLSLGFATDLFIPEVKGLYIRPLFMLSISPTSLSVKNYSSLTTEITLGINIGWKFLN